MLQIKRKNFMIWSFVLICTMMLILFTLKDIYLSVYWIILFVFASGCILCIKKRIVNALLVFSVFYVVLFAFGPMLLYKQGLNYYRLVGNYIIVSYLCFAIGYHYGGKKLFKCKLSKIFQPSNNHKTVFLISVIVFFAGAIAYSIYFIKSWRYIFIADLENGRVNAMTGNGLLLWTGSLIWLAVYMLYEQTLLNSHYKKTTYCMFAISTVFSILLGFRSALVNPILVMFFMKNKKKEISMQKMSVLAIILFAFVGIYGAIRSGGGSSIASLINEFKVSSVNLNNILETFPSRIDYQMGKTYLLDFLTLFDDNVQGTTSWLKTALKLSFSGGGVTPTLIGEFYINWGLVGVLIGMTLSGGLFKRLKQSYQNPYNSLFLSCLFLGYIRPIIRGGIANSIVTLSVYIIGYCCCQFIAKKIKV